MPMAVFGLVAVSPRRVTRDVESGDSCFSLVFLFMNCAKRKEMIL
jgi:hypothetical protein